MRVLRSQGGQIILIHNHAPCFSSENKSGRKLINIAQLARIASKFPIEFCNTEEFFAVYLRKLNRPEEGRNCTHRRTSQNSTS
mmetsp:Transcript_7501/g.13651  ORF Transcript_7501/g.13651 Transcript_7501/m.13651 type:complete len:83 (+) Transcript_7501:1521-1769(+)